MGQTTKIANQIKITGCMIGLIECLLYAQKAGLDQSQMIDAIKDGAAGSFSLNIYADRIIKGDMQPGFYVKHFVKDMEIAIKECQSMGIKL